MSVVRSFALWSATLVAVVALVVLSAPNGTPTLARIAHLETLVRCPACADLSVAQSNATSALAVRHEIERNVRSGQSDTQILTSLEATYGPTILLSPATSGVGALLWALPAAALAWLVLLGFRLWWRQ